MTFFETVRNLTEGDDHSINSAGLATDDAYRSSHDARLNTDNKLSHTAALYAHHKAMVLHSELGKTANTKAAQAHHELLASHHRAMHNYHQSQV